ncbi:MAG: PaaI family thioesterase [Proteobacteria bacterium]|nr:PaaI family thioesterase [Pseudomonadota bacterium]
MPFTPRNPDYAAVVRESYARQTFMLHLGAELGEIAPGRCTVHLKARKELTQQNGFLHGGVVAALADVAGGYAAFTLFEPGTDILTVEIKINYLAPASGEALIARSEVIKSGRTLTIVRCDVFAINDGVETLCAAGQGTLMTRGT